VKQAPSIERSQDHSGADKKDEQYWTAEFRRGNEQAAAYFFDLHYKSLCYFSSRLVNDQLQAEDIVSDCFFKIWQRRQDFQTAQNLKAFLYISCRNACMNYLQHLKVKTAVQADYLKQLEKGEETILYDIIRTEILDIVNKEIDLLPEKMAEIFKLLYFEGKKTDEIALQLNISVQTVRNQKVKAIGLLKTALFKRGISAAAYLAFLFFIEK